MLDNLTVNNAISILDKTYECKEMLGFLYGEFKQNTQAL